VKPYYRLEVRNENEDLICVREVPMATNSHRAIKAMHTKLTNWALLNFDTAKYTAIFHIER